MGKKNRRNRLKNVSTEDLSEKKQKPNCALFSYNKCYCRTEYTMNTTEFSWEIVDFWKLYKLRKNFFSEPFPQQADYFIQIEIRIFSLSDDSSKDMIGFYISTDQEIASYYSICQIGSNGNVMLQSDSTFVKNAMLLYETEASTLMQNSFKDLLKINFKFDIFSDLLNTTVYTKWLSLPSVKKIESEKLIDDNDSKFDDKEFITFIIDGKDYNISKNLLCATNSKYFKCLCNAKDDVTNRLIIADKPDVFKEMLSFLIINSISKLDLYIWEQRIRNSENTVEDFLITASKYGVSDLALLCEQILIREITIENALGLMQIAIETDAKCLKRCVTDFIKFHIKVMRNKQFLSLPDEQINETIKIINKHFESD